MHPGRAVLGARRRPRPVLVRAPAALAVLVRVVPVPVVLEVLLVRRVAVVSAGQAAPAVDSVRGAVPAAAAV